MKHFSLIIAFSLFAGAVSAQTVIKETDAAFARSQEIRGEAITAFRAGDMVTAKTKMLRALEERPNSIALLGNAAFLAAETGDTETAYKLAQRLAQMGINPGAGVQEKLQEKLDADTWLLLEKTFASNAQPIGKPTVAVTLSSDHKLIEGIAVDPKGNFYFSTVVSGTLLKTNAIKETSVLFDGHTIGLGSFFGIAYNRATQTLFATFATIDQTPKSETLSHETGVIEIDPETGQLIKKWTLPGGSDGQQIADIAVTPAGSVYVADAQGSKLYRLNADAFEVIPTTAAFMNPQGIVALDEIRMVMADYGRGLWYINTETGSSTLLAVPETETVTGIDGLFAHNGRIIAVQNGASPHRVIEISIDDAAKAITGINVLAQNLSWFDEPTLGTSTGGGITFVASSQWPKFGDEGVLREGTSFKPTKILSISDR